MNDLKKIIADMRGTFLVDVAEADARVKEWADQLEALGVRVSMSEFEKALDTLLNAQWGRAYDYHMGRVSRSEKTKKKLNRVRAEVLRLARLGVQP